jgi:hypothetical protein
MIYSGAVLAQQPDAEGPAPTEGAAPQKHRSGLPFMADEAL